MQPKLTESTTKPQFKPQSKGCEAGKLLRPETAIDSWRGWSADLHSRPVISEILSGGRSNRSFLLVADDAKMVLRINNEATRLPGIERNKEARIWQTASAAGIAPPLLYVDHQGEFLVSQYIENQPPLNPAINEDLIDQAFDLLQRCHRLAVGTKTIDYADHIEQYWKIIAASGQSLNPALHELRQPMHALVNKLQQSHAQTGLCHHDLVTANFVGGPERLYLIDWEYAAHGFIIMDYAALAVEWGIEDEVIVEKTHLAPELLSLARQLYNYLCALWGEVLGRPE